MDCISREQLVRELNAQVAVDAITKEVVIDMLEHLPPVTPKPKTECSCEQIKWERDTAIAQLKELGYGLGEKPKTGHWIMSDDGLYRPICNNCGAHPRKGYILTVEEATEVFKYCPNCGAKMESEG